MAGIGFQLKALFKEKSLSNKIKAYAYSSFVSSGPWIAAVLTVNIILVITQIYSNQIDDPELFLGTMVYTFVFTQIVTAPFQFIISRYYSDRLFERDYGAIKPAFSGLNMIVFAISTLVVTVFYFNRPLPLYYKLMAGYLFIVLSLIWILIVSMSSIKDYRAISRAFVIGGVVSIILTVIFINRPVNFESLTIQSNILLAYLIGLSLTYALLLYNFIKVFHFGNKNYFDFIEYLSLYPSLFYIGMFYTLGLWIDDVLMWFSQLGVSIVETYQYAPVYDNAVFLAYLTIIPSAVMFVVVIETGLYDRYKAYYNFINGEGTLEDIAVARDNVKQYVNTKLFQTFQIQAFITITIVLFSKPIFQLLNMSILIRNIFRIAAFGALFNIYILHIILIFLYFEERRKAVFVAVSFFITNGVFTYLFLPLGIRFYGYGFTVSAFLSFLVALMTMRSLFKQLTRNTYLSQPLAIVKPTGFFIVLARLLKVYAYTNDNLEDYKDK